jgi:hypothetical protein
MDSYISKYELSKAFSNKNTLIIYLDKVRLHCPHGYRLSYLAGLLLPVSLCLHVGWSSLGEPVPVLSSGGRKKL